MKKSLQISAIALAALVSLSACKQEVSNTQSAQTQTSGDPASLGNPVQQASYAMGVDIGRTLKQMKDQGTAVDLKLFNEAVQTMMDGKQPKINEIQAQEIMMTFLTEQQQKAQAKLAEASKENLAKGKAFLDENAKKEGIKTTASGLQYQVKSEGTGKSPKATDTVVVEYEGRLIDGTVFDSSKNSNGPISFPLNQVIKGWGEGVQLMKEGAEYTFFIPAELAYGDRQTGNIPANSALVFDIKLLKVEPAAQAK
ncbi:FKBP-type peptidyl-prolyl cis-trans isomerase [Neisseria weaveri]|uniref:FKBP-type peptidyl-prolyl cis-trans isomerase n=1 Tax=Neisseria weaveri TaxID=28091 RepID=UPI00022320C5|nr:FKBP-type peptidyl-prolyl cis-trans isomerase [Neisseria weaveri]EGV34732.1 FKBP-type peptidyl-prolyl cis-trans isomerase FkpA [Neisseria weaveri ATCC 51223]SAY50657.1 peptidyl-prolyl isomerase [Neisseria weaveri]